MNWVTEVNEMFDSSFEKSSLHSINFDFWYLSAAFQSLFIPVPR